MHQKNLVEDKCSHKSSSAKKDNNAKSGVNLYIMLAGKVIGGYSYPNTDVFGACSSLYGKSLQEVTVLSFQQWSETWKKKYSN
ncbi:hypothetical protein [Clostridium sp. CF012]|uniref:hypothetical protein n=1 Tax=Clostridium sp. CF012 TaxID=2843319 RepID=UPI001C0B67E0|nr:hypothetical protein [Clostridium sp. CF012]MBU3142535.1 hypothetical protein [Clostridium sp. CF012]